jgi:hypothetical protein
MTSSNGIAMIQELLTSYQEDVREAETTETEASEADLGVRRATLEPMSNWGTLILNATCIPDDIPYPADLRLLKAARETTE